MCSRRRRIRPGRPQYPNSELDLLKDKMGTGQNPANHFTVVASILLNPRVIQN